MLGANGVPEDEEKEIVSFAAIKAGITTHFLNETA